MRRKEKVVLNNTFLIPLVFIEQVVDRQSGKVAQARSLLIQNF